MTSKPMRMTDAPYETAMEYIDSDDWALEQKFDGARTLVIVSRGHDGELSFKWLASGGGPLKFAAAAQHIEELEEEIARAIAPSLTYLELDGELLIEKGQLHLFDLPAACSDKTLVNVHSPYEMRKRTLEDLFSEAFTRSNDRLHIVRTAYTHKEKLELWEAINAANVEGGMAKRRDAIYIYGGRTTEMMKLKLVKTADVVVTSVDRTFKADGKTLSHGKAELAVPIERGQDPKPYMNDKGKRISREEWAELGRTGKGKKQLTFAEHARTMLPVGNASLIGKPLSIEVGSVVEVAYLYFQDAMIQPRILRERLPEEKTAAQCDMAQFPTYSRERV